MNAFPSVDECRRRLHRAGWTVGACAVRGAGGSEVWRVSGRNAENAVEAEGAPQLGTGAGARRAGARSPRRTG
jgi:hypothetical protein